MGSTPTIAVAVSTYGRAALLPRLIAALEAQTLPPEDFEVVIVNDGSPDDTEAVLADAAARSTLNLRVISSDRNRGQAAGRNLAWRAARAPIIAFTDDDCVPTATWLEEGLRTIGDKSLIVVGRTTPNPEQLHLRERPFTRTVIVEDEKYFATCNIFYRREDIEAVDGFIESFTTHGGEDTDLAYRVRARGAAPVFAADALVYHDVRPPSFAATLRETVRWSGIPRLVRLHPSYRKQLIGRVFWKQSHPRALLAFAGILLMLVHPASLLLAAPWIYFRVKHAPLCPGPRRRWTALPGAFVIDLLEVAVMIGGSVRNRTLVL